MSPLPPDSTARVKFKYHVCGHDHVAQVRYTEPNTVDDVISAFNDLIGIIGDQMFATDLIEVTQAISGSNVFNPVADEALASWGSGAGTPAQTANMFDFVGRSLDGRRVRLSIFGSQADVSAGSYRETGVASSVVNDAVQLLNTSEGTFLSINGFQPVWHNYVNLGPNAYWRNKIR